MDALVVRTADLQALIRPWWLRRNAEAQATAKQYGASHNMARGGLSRMPGKPGMPAVLSGDRALEVWCGVSGRSVRAIANCETSWTGYYSRADPIVQALGLTMALQDGRLPIWANPFMYPASWRALMYRQGVCGDPWHELGVLNPWEHGYVRGVAVANGGNGSVTLAAG